MRRAVVNANQLGGAGGGGGGGGGGGKGTIGSQGGQHSMVYRNASDER